MGFNWNRWDALQYAGILQTFVSVIGPILGIIVDKKGPLLILIKNYIFMIGAFLNLTFNIKNKSKLYKSIIYNIQKN